MSSWQDDEEQQDAEVDRAPICESCGVTMLPATPGPGWDTEWECANDDCDASS